MGSIQSDDLNKKKSCDCEEYQSSMPELFGLLKYSWMNGAEYKGEKFKFCPWCGKELV